jgi:hypothetical protein
MTTTVSDMIDSTLLTKTLPTSGEAVAGAGSGARSRRTAHADRRSRWTRPIIGVALVVAIVVLSACSTIRFGYGQAPTLAYHWLDSWVDFDDAQALKARDALDGLFRWHRRTQLPDYAHWLSGFAARVTRDTTPDETCGTAKELGERWMKVVDHLMPAAAELGASLSDAQLARMQKRMDESNKRFRDDYVKRDPRAREESDLKRFVSRSEWIYGSLDDAQMAVLADAAKAPYFDVEVVIAERVRRQAELFEILRDGRRAVQEGPREPALTKLRATLKDWAHQGIESKRPGYREEQKRMQVYNCALSAKVHNVGGGAVRQAAREKLQGWAADAKALAEVSDPR